MRADESDTPPRSTTQAHTMIGNDEATIGDSAAHVSRVA
jgi:hypothetical protein